MQDRSLLVTMGLRIRAFSDDTFTTRAGEILDVVRLVDRASVTFWQLRATLDSPPVSPPSPVTGDPMDGSGASGALLLVQRSLVRRFRDFIASVGGMEEAFDRYQVPLPTPLPDAELYDEPRAGSPAFFRLGDASVEVETSSGRILYIIAQEIEAHVDPVRGRASALAMGDVIERAFAPTRPGDDLHAPGSLPLEPWLSHGALTIPGGDATDPVIPSIRVTDMTQTDSRIGYSEAGLTYQVITTWSIVAESP